MKNIICKRCDEADLLIPMVYLHSFTMKSIMFNSEEASDVPFFAWCRTCSDHCDWGGVVILIDDPTDEDPT